MTAHKWVKLPSGIRQACSECGLQREDRGPHSEPHRRWEYLWQFAKSVATRRLTRTYCPGRPTPTYHPNKGHK